MAALLLGLLPEISAQSILQPQGQSLHLATLCMPLCSQRQYNINLLIYK